MNRAHRIIWCKTKRMKVVVAENSSARGRGAAGGKTGKRSLLLVAGAVACMAFSFMPGQLWAAGAVCVDANNGTTTGLNQTASATGTVACGKDAVGSNYSMAIGSGATVTNSSTYAIAEGYKANVSAGGAIALGNQAGVSKSTITGGAPKPQTLIDLNLSYTERGLATNYNAERAVAIGQEAQARIRNSVAIGYGAVTDTNIYSNQYATPNPVNSIAIGTGAYASGNKTIAIGEEAGKGSLGWENVALGVKSGQNIKPMTVGCLEEFEYA